MDMFDPFFACERVRLTMFREGFQEIETSLKSHSENLTPPNI